MKRAHTSIRRATMADADSLKNLARSLATSFDFNEEAFNETFSRITDDENARLIVSNDEGGAIDAYLLGFTHDSFFANGPVAWIEEMFVIEAMRRHGVGLALEREFERWAKHQGAIMIALATRRGAPFYCAIGFEESATYFRKLL